MRDILSFDEFLNEDDGGLDIFRKGKAVHTPEGPLKSLKLQDVDDNVVVMHSKDGDFFHARGFTLVYFMDSPANAQLMKSGNIDYLLFPPQLTSTMFTRSPIKDIWKRKKKFEGDLGGTEHILGAIEAYVDGKEIYIDMMSVRPGFKNAHIATLMVDALKKNWPGLSMRTSHRTDDGSKFFAKYDPSVPQNESLDPMRNIPTYQEFVNEGAAYNSYSTYLQSTDAWDPKAINSDEFSKSVSDEMNWQYNLIFKIEPKNSYVKDVTKKHPKEWFPKCTRFYIYECQDGSSIRADLLKACTDKGYKDAKVAVIDNKLRGCEHTYLIGLP